MTLNKLFSIIKNRIKLLPENSYVVSLYKKGEDAILQKIGEEATEVIIAVKGKKRKRMIEEIADLWFMTLILLAKNKITIGDIEKEIERRQK